MMIYFSVIQFSLIFRTISDTLFYAGFSMTMAASHLALTQVEETARVYISSQLELSLIIILVQGNVFCFLFFVFWVMKNQLGVNVNNFQLSLSRKNWDSSDPLPSASTSMFLNYCCSPTEMTQTAHLKLVTLGSICPRWLSLITHHFRFFIFFRPS